MGRSVPGRLPFFAGARGQEMNEEIFDIKTQISKLVDAELLLKIIVEALRETEKQLKKLEVK